MVQNDDQSVNSFLTDISPNDKPWDKHKAFCVAISNALSINEEFLTRGYNLNQCAEWLVYTATNNQDKPLALSNANFCRDRACPICQWRRALRWVATMHQQLPNVHEIYPTHRWLFVTLTVRNCELIELRNTIKDMNQAFKRLVRTLKKRMPTIGYIRTTEVTRAKDDTAHPHFHCMLLVPADYFSRNYIKQAEWTELWQNALKCDYMPIVDVRTVKPKDKGNNLDNILDDMLKNAQNARISQAIAETMKYAVKPSDLLKKSKYEEYEEYWWLYEYLRQVKGLRFVVIGGSLRGLIKAEWGTEESDEDLIHISDTDTEQSDDQLEIRFDFDRYVSRYKHKK